MTAPPDRPTTASPDLAPISGRHSDPLPDDGPVRRHWLQAVLAVLLLGGGVAIGRVWPTTTTPTSEAAAKPSFPPRPVETITLTRGNSTRSIRLIGQVEPRSSATIRPRVDGLLEEIRVQPGDRVSAGTILAILDNADRRVALSQAEARLAEAGSELARLEAGTRVEIIAQREAALQAARAREVEARDNLERTQRLVDEGALSRRILVEAETSLDAATNARLEAAATLAEAAAGPRVEDITTQRATVAANRAEVEQARLLLDRTVIRAAAAGTVRSRVASAGDYLEVGDPILTLVSGDTVDIFLEVPEELGARIEPGMLVRLSSRALPDWRPEVAIAAIIPTAEAASRQLRVRLPLDNPPEDLVPGVAVLGELELPVSTDGFVIPRDALTARGTQRFAFVVADDNTARELQVEVLADLGAQVAIAHPELGEGQALVVKGGDGLREGAAVKVVSLTES